MFGLGKKTCARRAFTTVQCTQCHLRTVIGLSEVRGKMNKAIGKMSRYTTTRMEGQTVGYGEIPNSACAKLRKANSTKQEWDGEIKEEKRKPEDTANSWSRNTRPWG